MPPFYSVTPLSPAAAYDGSLFIYADPAALFSARLAFEQARAATNTPSTPSCRIQDVEDDILPLLSTRDSSPFKPCPISHNHTPGSLLISRRDGKQFYLRHNGLPIVDFRTLNASIASAHVAPAFHHSAASTLATLNGKFSLIPEEYVLSILSLCSHCAQVDKPPFQDVSNLVLPPDSSSVPEATCSPHSPSSLEQLTTEAVCVPDTQRKRSAPDSPAASTRPKKSNRLRFDCSRPLILDDEHPSASSFPSSPPSPPSPFPTYSSFETAGVADDAEIADFFFDDEADTHEDFLLMMHTAYQMAGFAADHLLGTREGIEEAAAEEDYYYDD